MEPEANDAETRLGATTVAAEPLTFAESFAAAEQAAFDFLVGEHGFQRAEREVGHSGSERGVYGRVVYRSPASAKGLSRAVMLTIAPLRLELELELSRTASPPCRIEELHALEGRGAFPRRQHGLYDAMHEPQQLQAEFMRLAGVLRAFGARFFDDDPYLWEDLEERRMRQAEDDGVRQALVLSKERFRAREWKQVIDILAPLEHRLGTTATARLAYAKRKARQGG
ncbi:MAG: hypothetical protein ABIQ06_06295 [Caldimonas sp.]